MILSTTSKVQYNSNGSTLIFVVPFYFVLDSHLRITVTNSVTTDDSTLALGSDYTVTGAGAGDGGTIVLVSAQPINWRITINRVVPITQIAHYISNDSFSSITHEAALDRLTMICQMLAEALTRTVILPEGELSSVTMVLPKKAARLDKILGFDSDGNLTAT